MPSREAYSLKKEKHGNCEIDSAIMYWPNTGNHVVACRLTVLNDFVTHHDFGHAKHQGEALRVQEDMLAKARLLTIESNALVRKLVSLKRAKRKGNG